MLFVSVTDATMEDKQHLHIINIIKTQTRLW